MIIRNTHKIVLFSILAIGFFSAATAQNNAGTIKGYVRDENKKPIVNADVILYRNDELVSKKQSAVNGEFTFANVEPDFYTIKVVRTGYLEYNHPPFEVSPNNTNNLDIVISEKAVEFRKVVGLGSDSKRKLADDKTSTTYTQKAIIRTGVRDPGGLANYASGVTKTAGGISGRGSRTDATAYFVDGVRVFGSGGVSQAFAGSVDILQAGIPAQYGDFTGLGVSITTRGGVSGIKAKSLEVQSSSMFNPYHHNLIEGFIAMPILFRKNPLYTATSVDEQKRIAMAAMNFGVTFQYQREPTPSYVGYQQIKDEKLEELEKNPLAVNKDGGFVNSANFLSEDDFDKVKVRNNSRNLSTNVFAKFDFRLSELATLTAFGNFSYSNAMNPSNNNSILIYKTNPLRTSTYAFSYLKFTQRFKDPDSTKKANGTTLNNAYFTVRVDYQSSWSKTQDENFKDNYFDYGYIGQFKHYPTEFFSYYGNLNNPNAPSRRFVDQNGDTVFLRNFWEQTGFRDTSIKFTASGENAVRANYTRKVFDKTKEEGGAIFSDAQILQSQGLLNGYNPNSIYSLFNTPGFQQAAYSKSQNERYTLYALGEAEVKGPVKADKKSSAHALQFGLTYEQVVNRGYFINANDLWRLMYQLANSHISELDRNNPILSYDATGRFQDTIKYNRLVNANKQTHFDREFRNKLISQGATDVYGKKVDDKTFIDINSYKPGDFSLDMFNADELLNNGSSYVNYFGYDHLGKKTRGRPGVNDFLLDKDKRSIGAFMPIYTAAWFQDKFYLDDLEFRLGLRLERYDANQLVLKDPYSLYPIKTAGEVSEIDGNPVTHPSNIGDDYAVYVNDVKNPTQILGYRKDNNWYNASGVITTGDFIANANKNTGKIAPYLVDPNQKVITENSFKDYKPKVNILPRVFFKFPLNKQSLFYASYDVLAQRPSAGANFLTIDDYFYLTQKNSANPLANPALTSRITTDYQIGFKNQISKSTQLNLISYYRETKNDISVFQYNQAYPITYISYNNIDFSTVKGFIIEMAYQAKNNISLNGNYTLQVADGTGSNINSQRALIASNQPNLRSLFPLGDLDIRHQLKGIFDWGFPDRKKGEYIGPIIGKTKVLANTNFNVTCAATSGLPYTATSQPVQSGSVDRAPIKGTPYGSRLPWQFTVNLNISKDFQLKWNDNKGKSKNAFVQVYFYTTNLFNSQNVNGVYPYTGSPSDDGFLNSPKGQQALTNQLSAEAYNYYYRTAINSPGNYQAPRFMRLGAKLNF